MSRKDVVSQLNSFFADAQTSGLQARDGGRCIRTDLATGLSLNDILTSALSPELKALVTLGLQTSQGVMMTEIFRHPPQGGKKGQIDFELAGAKTRLGGELVAYYDSQGESEYLHVGPSLKLMTMGYLDLFDEFRNRPEKMQERDAFVLVTLARKAIGLEE